MIRFRPLAKPASHRPTFEAVALAELPVLYRVARRLTLNAEEAEDLVGQALLNATKSWSSFDGAHPRSWLIKIMRNVFLESKRSYAPVAQELDEQTSDGTDVVSCINAKTIAENIYQELDRMPEEYRLAVALCDVEEMTYEEAADALGVPVGTVRSRLFRGRRILRDKVAPLGMEGF